jgi:hypothetical protein
MWDFGFWICIQSKIGNRICRSPGGKKESLHFAEEPEDWLRTSDTTSFLVPFLSSNCELSHDF